MNRLIIPVDSDDHAQGPADAPVTLLEYGDYQCPACGDAYPIIKAVKRDMGDRLRFVFRNFPIADLHPHAMRAAKFAEAAAMVGKYWAAHDLLFEHQYALTQDHLISYGARIGLGEQAVRSAFDGRFDQRIQRDFRGGVLSGVNGTPTLFINGIQYEGPLEVGKLLQAVSNGPRDLTNATSFSP